MPRCRSSESLAPQPQRCPRRPTSRHDDNPADTGATPTTNAAGTGPTAGRAASRPAVTTMRNKESAIPKARPTRPDTSGSQNHTPTARQIARPPPDQNHTGNTDAICTNATTPETPRASRRADLPSPRQTATRRPLLVFRSLLEDVMRHERGLRGYPIVCHCGVTKHVTQTMDMTPTGIRHPR